VLAQKNKLGFKENEGPYGVQWRDVEIDTTWKWVTNYDVGKGSDIVIFNFKTLAEAEAFIDGEQTKEFQEKWEVIPLSNGKAEM
jgi:hypothetical protein